jgi:hypothetical protein
MKKLLIAVAYLAAVATLAFGQSLSDTFAQVDALNKVEKNQETVPLLTAALTKAGTGAEKAEVLWRLSRCYESLGKAAKNAGKDGQVIQDLHLQGEGFADQGIAADANSYLSYYWKSANMGRWAESKGILNSLFKAGPMRDAILKSVSIYPDYADSYGVLCQLYYKAPGFPLSFGNADMAASYGRYGIAVNQKDVAAGREELDYDFTCELGGALWARNWDAAKRVAEQAKKKANLAGAKTSAEKAALYEANVQLEAIGDRQEAEKLERWVIAQIEPKQTKTPGERDALIKAKQKLGDWGIK